MYCQYCGRPAEEGDFNQNLSSYSGYDDEGEEHSTLLLVSSARCGGCGTYSRFDYNLDDNNLDYYDYHDEHQRELEAY